MSIASPGWGVCVCNKTGQLEVANRDTRYVGGFDIWGDPLNDAQTGNIGVAVQSIA